MVPLDVPLHKVCVKRLRLWHFLKLSRDLHTTPQSFKVDHTLYYNICTVNVSNGTSYSGCSVQIHQYFTVYVNVSTVMPAHILNFVSQTQSTAINRNLISLY